MELDERTLQDHKQLSQYSCIPMAVELVLKFIRRVPADYFELQRGWHDRNDGNFSHFDGRIEKGTHFVRQFAQERNPKFPLSDLFSAIERELSSERYVVISLEVPGGWHNYVIYNQLPNAEFQAVTKGRWPEQIDNVKEIVRRMNGTDILTYRFL